jgi:hypothetical protein
MDAEQLRETLFAAIAREDGQAILALCIQHETAIRESFRSWTRIPVDIRGDRAAVQAWANALVTIARYFEAAGDPGLFEILKGGADSPMTLWPRVFSEATQRAEAGEYKESTRLLLTILPALEGARGSAVDDWRPKTYGLLGTNAFREGDLSSAHDYTMKALADCQRADDRQGVWTYTQNLRMLEAAREIRAGSGTPSVAARLRSQIARAQDLSDDLWYAESNALLQEALVKMRELPEADDEYRGKIHGLLGLNAFRCGDLAQAEAQTRLALEACQDVSDAEGVRIYTFNLEHIRSQVQ